MVTTRSISTQRSSAFGTGCGIVIVLLFGGVFGFFSILIIYMAGIRPLMQVSSAQSWTQTQCEITYSGIENSGKTSRVNIQYRYSWNDRTYTGKRYDFNTGSDN